MNSSEKKVIVLKNVKSEYIEQAILILKDKTNAVQPGAAENIVLEAEEIVRSYSESCREHSAVLQQAESCLKSASDTAQVQPEAQCARKKRIDLRFWFLIGGVLALAAVLLFVFL